MIQDHQLNTIIKCYDIFTSCLSTNNKNFQQGLGLHSQSTIPPTLFLIMYPSTNTWSISSDNISPSHDATTYYSSCFDLLQGKIIKCFNNLKNKSITKVNDLIALTRDLTKNRKNQFFSYRKILASQTTPRNSKK